jgi:hypothetical protein
MGTEIAWVPLVAAAVAGAGTYYNNRKVANEQDDLLAAQIMRKGTKQKEADALVNQAIGDVASSTGEGERGSALAGYLAQLRQAGTGTGQLLGMPLGSEEFREAANDAAIGVRQFGEGRAGLLSRLDAPILQREREAKQRGRTADKIDLIKREDAGDDATTAIKLKGVRANPWVEALAAAAGGYASTAGTGTGGTGTTSTATRNGINGGTTYGRSNLYGGGVMS